MEPVCQGSSKGRKAIFLRALFMLALLVKPKMTICLCYLDRNSGPVLESDKLQILSFPDGHNFLCGF